MVRAISIVVSRFPEHEVAVRRLYAGDPAFRTICADLDEAQRALQHWQSWKRPPGASWCQVQQYRELLRELESEIAIRIERFESFAQPRSQQRS